MFNSLSRDEDHSLAYKIRLQAYFSILFYKFICGQSDCVPSHQEHSKSGYVHHSVETWHS